MYYLKVSFNIKSGPQDFSFFVFLTAFRISSKTISLSSSSNIDSSSSSGYGSSGKVVPSRVLKYSRKLFAVTAGLNDLCLGNVL